MTAEILEERIKGTIARIMEAPLAVPARLSFSVPGEPVAKARPRATKWGVYTPKKTVNYETLVRETFAAAYPGHAPWQGPIRMTIMAYLTIPRSKSKKQQAAMAAGELLPTKRPDLDNIEKTILDALNGVAFHDDSQVCLVTKSKAYADRPRADIFLEEMR